MKILKRLLTALGIIAAVLICLYSIFFDSVNNAIRYSVAETQYSRGEYSQACETLMKIKNFSDDGNCFALYEICAAHTDYERGDYESAYNAVYVYKYYTPPDERNPLEEDFIRDVDARHIQYTAAHPSCLPSVSPAPSPSPSPAPASIPRGTSRSSPQYYDAEDFYEDYYEEFEDFDEAEDYYLDHYRDK